jgi:hypothetical protein
MWFLIMFFFLSIDRNDFEWAIWDIEGTKSNAHVQQRRKSLCNCGIRVHVKGTFKWWLFEKVGLLEEFITEIQETLLQNIHKAKSYFWSFFLFVCFFKKNMYKIMPWKSNREYTYLFLKISWLAQTEQFSVDFIGASCSRGKTKIEIDYFYDSCI